MGADAQLYMDAVITPNRSLSRRGLWLLMSLLAAYNLILMVFLLVIGAFPVPIFLGLDFAGIALAFHISNRRARRAERVRVSAEAVEVVRQDGGRPSTVWSSPTAFTRVTLENGGEHHARVELRLSGKALPIAAALSPKERTAFAEALERAIATARGARG
jgi:uncharacterized membrane protein